MKLQTEYQMIEIISVADLALRDQSHIVECGPLPHRIERVAFDHDVLDQGQQRLGIARVLQRQG